MEPKLIDSAGTRVLIVDDVPANLKVLRDVLESEGYRIVGVPDGKTALRIAGDTQPDIILLDVMMPQMNGYEVCQRLKRNEATRHIPVIFITVRDEKESLAKSFSLGGVDYITKPFEKEEVLCRVETHLKISALTQALFQKNDELSEEITIRKRAEAEREKATTALINESEKLSTLSQQEAERWGIPNFIGKSLTIARTVNEIRQLQNSNSISVLVTGESGTGKELVARAIHFGGKRGSFPFVPLNCSAIPSELAESTLFGHLRGAFTGANAPHKGCFELADGGTLFLDEIGEMPITLQVKLLRALEDGVITPVGGTQPKRCDVRIIAATNVEPQTKISEGTFREDLYFRLAGFTVSVPPLRERPGDIPLLAQHFLKVFAQEMGIGKERTEKKGKLEKGVASLQLPRLSPEALAALMNYHFPGNIRELKNMIEHALIRSGNTTLLPEHFHFIDDSYAQATKKSSARVEHAQPSDNIEAIESLVVKRSQVQTTSEITDEERIMSYVRQHGNISNPECRDFLEVDLHRASYLLRKMNRYGLLVRSGEHRWSRYCLP